MRADDLTPFQAEALKRHLQPMLRYLGQMLERMHKRRFPPDDPLLEATRDAYNTMHALHIEVHYLSCESGVGRRAQTERRDDRQ